MRPMPRGAGWTIRPSTVDPPDVDQTLEGRRALVTGGARGIGRGTAIALARRGADVAVNALPSGPDVEAMQTLRAEVEALGRRFVAVPGDIGVREEALAVAARAGDVDILVGNAGICPLAPILKLEHEDFERTFAVNLFGAFWIAQHVARGMVERGSGSIVLVTSYNAFLSSPRQVHYAASKAALDMLGKGMARELGPYGVRVNMVAPAAIVTDLSRARWETDEAKEELAWWVPLNRLGEPSDVAEAICFLASDAASYINGASLAIDGGVMTSKR